jgi:hypothetical protein
MKHLNIECKQPIFGSIFGSIFGPVVYVVYVVYVVIILYTFVTNKIISGIFTNNFIGFPI